MQSLPAVVVVKIARDGEVIGDFSWSDVRPLIACGSILPTDHFWYEGMAEWRLVTEEWPAPNNIVEEDLKQVIDAPVQKVQEDNTPKLMPCPSCERQISIKARACPHCGHPLLGLHMQKFGSRQARTKEGDQMKKKPRKKQEAKPETPPTFLDVVRAKGWGQGDRAMHPEPGKDRYFVTAGGKVEDKDWEPNADDWALFAEMMRDRVNSMREPKS